VCVRPASFIIRSYLNLATQIIFKPDPAGYPVRGIFISGNEFAGLGDGERDIVALPPSQGGTNYTLWTRRHSYWEPF